MKPRALLNLIGGIVCFALTIFAVIAAIIYGASLSPIGKLVVLGFLPVLPVLTMFFESSATASGQISGIKFSTRGMVAAYVVVLLILWWIMPAPQTRTVRIVIRDQGTQIQEGFTALILVPKQDLIKKVGDTGEVSVELDTTLEAITSLTIDCKGYQTATQQNEPIPDSGIIGVELMRAATEPPSPPATDPSADAMEQRPSAEQAGSPPVIPPEAVTLHYRNISGEPLKLLLLDWSRYYRFAKEGRAGASPWISIPVESRDEYTPYNKFRSGSGWYTICIRDKSGALHEATLANLFEAKSALLTLDKNGSAYTAQLDIGGEL